MELVALLGILIVIGFFFLMRAFGAWMFRIDEVVEQLKQINFRLKKLEDKNATYSYPDPENPGKMITTTATEYFQMLGGNKKMSSSGILGPISSDPNDMIQPIKEDTNLSSLLNSNGSNKIDVILARQPVIHEA